MYMQSPQHFYRFCGWHSSSFSTWPILRELAVGKLLRMCSSYFQKILGNFIWLANCVSHCCCCIFIQNTFCSLRNVQHHHIMMGIYATEVKCFHWHLIYKLVKMPLRIKHKDILNFSQIQRTSHFCHNWLDQKYIIFFVLSATALYLGLPLICFRVNYVVDTSNGHLPYKSSIYLFCSLDFQIYNVAKVSECSLHNRWTTME